MVEMETEVVVAMVKAVMAEEAMAATGSEAEVKVSQDPTALIDKALHRAVAQIGSHPTRVDEGAPIPITMVVGARAPREAAVRDEEAKVKDVHHLHKVVQDPMLIDKEIRQPGHQMEGHREVNKVAAIGTKVKAKAKDRIIRMGTRTVTRIRVTGAKVNKIKARTKVRTTKAKTIIKARTTTTKARTTTIRGRTTTTKGKTKTEIEVKASRTKVSKTRATGGKDRHKTRGSFRTTTTTTIITIIIMATTTSPSQKSLSLRRRPRSRPQRPNRLRPPPPKPNRQNNRRRLLLLLLLPQQKHRLSLLNHRQHWLRRHHLLNKRRHLRL